MVETVMSFRVKLLFGILIATLIWVGGSSWIASWGQGNQELQSLLEQAELQEREIADVRRMTTSLTDWSRTALPKDRSRAAAIYLPFLTKLTDLCALQKLSLIPASIVATDNRITWWNIQLYAEGSPSQWADFFERFTKTAVTHQIIRWEFRPLDAVVLAGTLTIEVLTMEDSQWNDRSLDIPEIDSEPSLFASGEWFGRQDAILTDVLPVQPEVDAFSENNLPPEPRVTLELIGTLQSGELSEAWFLDTQTGRETVCKINQKIPLGNQSATLQTIEELAVTILQEGKEVRIEIGESIPMAEELLQ